MVIFQFIYASVMHPAAHKITNIPASARKLLCESEYRAFNKKNNTDNMEKIITTIDNPENGEDVNFITAPTQNPSIVIHDAIFDIRDVGEGMVVNVFFGINTNMDSIHMQVNNNKYFAI